MDTEFNQKPLNMKYPYPKLTDQIIFHNVPTYKFNIFVYRFLK